MKTTKIFAIATAALAMSFASCTKETGNISSDEMTKLSVRINGISATRAVEAPGLDVSNTIQLVAGDNHSIFVIDPRGDVLLHEPLNIVDAISPAGQILSAVPADARIYIIANIPSDDVATIQGLTSWSAIQSATSAMTTQTDYTVVALANSSGQPEGFAAIDGSATVNVSIKPLISRLELTQVKTTDTKDGEITAFSVTGVFVDGYYPEFTYVGGGNGSPFAQGQSTTFTGIGDTGYWDAEGAPLAAKPGKSDVWAHQVAAAGVPRFIIRLEDIKYIPDGGSEIELEGVYYLTVSGYTISSIPITEFERGKIYRIGAANGITFTYDDLGLTANPVDIELTVMVAVEEWVIETPDADLM